MVTPILAGEVAPTSSPAAPVMASESYGWFLGGGGDYLIDSEEAYWNGHIGYNLSDVSSLFLEVGWVGSDEDVSVAGVNFNVDVDIVPVTLNYQYEWALGDQLSWYLGVGAGAASIDVDAAGGFGSDDQWSFMAQAFTGLVYEFTPAVEAYLGVRYMWFDEPDFNNGGGADLDDFDDFGIGAGLRFNF